jgi:hypothetical protein
MRIVIYFALLLLVGCKQVEYVSVENVVKDTIYKEIVKIDSIIQTDSVFLHIHTKGDTVYSEKVKVLYRDRYKYERDTIYLHRTDTIKVPIPIEHKATIWERIEYRVDDVVSIIGVIIVGGFILLFIQLLRRQK